MRHLILSFGTSFVDSLTNQRIGTEFGGVWIDGKMFNTEIKDILAAMAVRLGVAMWCLICRRYEPIADVYLVQEKIKKVKNKTYLWCIDYVGIYCGPHRSILVGSLP